MNGKRTALLESFHPLFRWPMRILGGVLLFGTLARGLAEQRWDWSSPLFASALILWSLQTPHRVPRGYSPALRRLISILLIIFMISVALMLFGYFVWPWE